MRSILSKSLFSKILATENINLEILKEAKTASFNYSTRTLTLPDWKTSESLERLLISHEVAHALYTDSIRRTIFLESYPENERSFVRRVLNIVEDARIEKLIMRKYPGLIKDYILGYKELVDDYKFFPGKYDNIYDNLNHHFKVNISGQQKETINYSNEELYFIDRMLFMETYENSIDVTRELVDKFKVNVSDIETSTVFDIGLSPTIDVSIEEGLSDLDSGNGSNSSMFESEISNFTIERLKYQKYVVSESKILQIKNTLENNPISRYMSSIFKKKMNAKNYNDQIRRKSGNLDVNRLYRYRYDEKIFSEKVIRPKQKSHCVVMLIDGSGSMGSLMKHVAVQAYNIADFCRISKIPMRCFIFQEPHGYVINSFLGKMKVRLIEFFRHPKNFKDDVSIMSRTSNGGTPLSESLMVLIDLIEDLQTKYDIVNLLVITDGACQNSYVKLDTLRYKNIYMSSYNDTKNPESVPTLLYRLFRDYFKINIISFDLVGNGCYNSQDNVKGVDRHFRVPVDIISDPVNSRRFLDELIEIISK